MRTRLVPLGLSSVILALLAWQTRVWDAGDAFEGFEAWAAVGALVLNAPVLLAMAVRSWIVVRKVEPSAPFPGAASIAVTANLAGQLTPANAGDLWRAYAYRDEYGLPGGSGVAIVVYERTFSFYLMALGAGAMTLYELALGGTLSLVALASGTVLLGFVPALVYPALHPALQRFLASSGRWSLGRASAFSRVSEAVQEGGGTLRALFGNRRLAAGYIAATYAYLFLSTVQVWLIARGLGASLSFTETWYVLGVAGTVGAASSLPFGLGVTDGGIVLLARSLDVPLEPATALAVLVRLLQTLPLGLAGLAAYWLRVMWPGVRRETPPMAAGDNTVLARGR